MGSQCPQTRTRSDHSDLQIPRQPTGVCKLHGQNAGETRCSPGSGRSTALAGANEHPQDEKNGCLVVARWLFRPASTQRLFAGRGGKGCVSRTLISPHACLVITKGRINERVTQGARHLNPAPHQRFCLGPGHRKGAGTQQGRKSRQVNSPLDPLPGHSPQLRGRKKGLWL